MGATLLTFLGVSVLLTALPGPDSLLVVRSGLRGRARATAVGAGTAIAALGWGVAAAFGVAIILARSARAFEVVKIAGSIYLVGLGLHTLWTNRKTPGTAPAADAPPAGGGVWTGLRTGLIAGLLNPKTGLFYVAVLPQILPKNLPVLPSTLAFAGIDSVVVVAYTALLAALATVLLRYLRRPKVLRYAERTTGVCLIGLGARAAFERA